MEERGRVGRLLMHHPSGLLLVAQVVVVLVYPFTHGSRTGNAALSIGSLLVISAAIWMVRNTPALTVAAISLGVPAVLFSIAEVIWVDNDTITVVSGLLHAAFYLYVSYAMIRYLFDDEQVTRDELFAAGAAFTVVAWAFAYLYLAIDAAWPNSFSDIHHGPRGWFELLYLSFTTLTSVGLSDIAPVEGHARSVVMIEEVAGVMYVGVVVSRIVGLTLRRGIRR